MRTMARKKRSKRKSSTSTLGVDAKRVLRLLQEAGKPLSTQEILKSLQASQKEGHRLKTVLAELVEDGKLYKLKRGAYGLAQQLNIKTGELEVQRSGVGFVILDEEDTADIFIPPGDMGDAWHRDRVTVAVLPGGKGRRREGRITSVLERGYKVLPVRAGRRLGEYFLMEPTEPRLTPRFLLPADSLDEAPELGEILMVSPGEPLDKGLWECALVSRLGQEEDPAVQETLVKENHAIPRDFPQSVLAEAAGFPENPAPEDLEDRKDLRETPFVTIDGAKAKDFDDAVHVVKEGAGWRLWVAIADVSHYVKAGSELDKEARVRGNSYYFPQSVEPMFPEALSNGLCSLNPDVERLVMVAEVPFYADGQPGAAEVYAAVIKSHARLTYAQVKRVLLDKDDAERAAVEPVLPMLEEAERLARVLRKVRSKRGSLDFDLPEPEILFNIYGETVEIRPKTRHFGHMMIEEFMIAANEAVARILEADAKPCLYRVHPEPDPDKLAGLLDLLAVTDLAPQLPRPSKGQEGLAPTQLQELLAAAEGTDMEFLVNRMTLRTMMQAKYSPENTGHYGLASECYCHFTSPIRRYADLTVHRSLKNFIARQEVERLPSVQGLKSLADDLSTTERTAMDAEREILKRITILFLRDKVGESFTGVVNSIADFGFWVELEEVMAEGLVRLSTMTDDYYTFLPERQELLGTRTGRRLKLGQRVRVQLVNVTLARLEVNLDLLAVERPVIAADDEAHDEAGAPGADAAGESVETHFQPVATQEQASRKRRSRGSRGSRGGRKKQRPAETSPANGDADQAAHAAEHESTEPAGAAETQAAGDAEPKAQPNQRAAKGRGAKKAAVKKSGRAPRAALSSKRSIFGLTTAPGVASSENEAADDSPAAENSAGSQDTSADATHDENGATGENSGPKKRRRPRRRPRRKKKSADTPEASVPHETTEGPDAPGGGGEGDAAPEG